MFCRGHNSDIDHKDLLEHILEHQLTIEGYIMGDLTKLTDDITTLIAAKAATDAENAQLKADAASNASNDQAAIDALDATVTAALPAPVDTAPVDAGDAGTPIADSIDPNAPAA